jgi:amino acid adenylation domain-containing protein
LEKTAELPAMAASRPRLPESLVYACFEKNAQAFPQRTAIVSGKASLTYGELYEASGRLANKLHAAGVKKGNVVAIITDRNAAFICGMIAVLRVGATFAIIDAAYPSDRVRMNCAIAAPSLVLLWGDGGRHEECIPGQTPRLALPRDPKKLLAELACEEAEVRQDVDPKDTAYLMFTSGSTGLPKCIATQHYPLPHFIAWHKTEFGLREDDRFSMLSGLSHDPLLRDIFTPLSIGATLYVPPQEALFDPTLLFEWLSSQEITVAHITPPLGQVVVAGAKDRKLSVLRYFFWSGDRLRPTLVASLRAIAPQASHVNFYGTTETPQAMGFHRICAAPTCGEKIPIGRGIPDVDLLVLDKALNVLPAGEVGEIGVRTAYLSLGYVNDKDATARKYIQNPQAKTQAERIYLTGDLGRYREDGLIEFCGRNDDQVKIRGYRVELEEVAKSLRAHPGIHDAIVLANQSETGETWLMAHIVPKAAGKLDVPEISSFVRATLPKHMHPSRYAILERFPLLPNGKVDRATLRAQQARSDAQESAEAAGETDASLSKEEAELLEIWKSVLGHSRVTVDDSFVELGGDSLSAISVLIRMQRRGIPEAVARGIFQGWSIRQIVARANGTSAAGGNITANSKARINQMVNVVRGVLVAILVASHWFEGLLNRLPAGFRPLQNVLYPLFNVSTPGFALVFGLGIGYIFYPRFATESQQVRRSMRLGFYLVTAGIVIRSIAGLTMIVATGGSLNATVFFDSFYSALLYYALALLTVPLWFRLISWKGWPYLNLAVMITLAYVLQRIVWVQLEREQTGFLQLCRLMLVAKFSYLTMSIGALSGVGAGIYLARWAAAKRTLRDLFPRLSVGGVVLILAGTAMAFLVDGNMQAFIDESAMPVYRWVFYAGTILVLAALLSVVLSRYERVPRIFREPLNIIAVLGQISLPVFIFHQLVLRAKALLVLAGLPDGVALAIPLLIFVGLCWWMMRKLYRLYYAKV